MVTMSVFLLLRAVVRSIGNFTIIVIRAETDIDFFVGSETVRVDTHIYDS